ncbi:hypothetical protein H4S14_003530 [Agrobacterium vitis]|nr:hypothetical protein [Agrobacterium vitis]MBE1439765.1 hypothetical protein [Agrobacterium vitis]
MNIEGMEFDDELTPINGPENLWRAVLLSAIDEALRGPSMSTAMLTDKSVTYRIRCIKEARDYVIRPNKDFNMVCSLAGLDPDAARERIAKQIAAAPSPEELANTDRQAHRRTTKSTPKSRQKREVRRFAHDGMNLTIAEWAKVSGVTDGTIRQRLGLGWPISRAIEKVDGRLGRTRTVGQKADGWRAPGASFNFGRSKGTGGGSTVQETPNITFLGSDVCPQ